MIMTSTGAANAQSKREGVAAGNNFQPRRQWMCTRCPQSLCAPSLCQRSDRKAFNEKFAGSIPAQTALFLTGRVGESIALNG